MQNESRILTTTTRNPEVDGESGENVERDSREKRETREKVERM